MSCKWGACQWIHTSNATYPTEQWLLAHVENAHCTKAFGQDAFNCGWAECTRWFYSLQALKRHIRFHCLGKVYKCRFCTREFDVCDTRRRHERDAHLIPPKQQPPQLPRAVFSEPWLIEIDPLFLKLLATTPDPPFMLEPIC